MLIFNSAQTADLAAVPQCSRPIVVTWLFLKSIAPTYDGTLSVGQLTSDRHQRGVMPALRSLLE